MRLYLTGLTTIILLLATPSVAQREEGEPYFSLSSSQTYAPGDSPSIQMWANGVEALQFRVYKVNDPVQFFRQLEDPHRFGGRAPKPPKRATPIEIFHRWKRTVRARIRDLFRTQYTAESRSRIRAWLHPPPPPDVRPAGPAAVRYADVPLLNPDQVVTVWEQPIPPGPRWDARTVPIQVSKKGVYLVEATNGALKAYTVVQVSGIATVAKAAPGKVLVRVVDRASGAPLRDCPVYLWFNQSRGQEFKTDGDGFVEAGIATDEPVENLLVMARRGDDFAVNSVYTWNLNQDPDRETEAYIYTDRPVYRPGHEVHFRGILRARTADGYALPGRQSVEVEVAGAGNQTVFNKSVRISDYGSFDSSFQLPADAPLGYYNIEAAFGDTRRYGGFHVEEYRKPQFKVTVTPQERRRLQGDEIEAVIDARFYYGEPVAFGKVRYEVFRSRYYSPWGATDEPDLEEQSGWDQRQVLRESGELDAQGLLTIRIPTEPEEHDAIYRIRAAVMDATNQQVEGSGYALATVGPFFVTISPERYVYEPGQMARFQVRATDYDGNPVPGVSLRVQLLAHDWTNREQEAEVLAMRFGRTTETGEGAVDLEAPNRGSLRARVFARTPSGREVTDDAYIWVSGDASWYGARQQRLQIIPDKKSYAPGGTARVLIVTGVPECRLWIAAEGQTVRSSRFIDVDGPTVTVDVPIVKEFAPNFFLTALFLRDGQLYQGSKDISVPPVEQKLDVQITSSKEQFKPGEAGLFTVTAKDHAGRPVEAEFSLGVVDEAIYAVRKDTQTPILDAFYGYTWNRVSGSTSLSYYFSGEAGKRSMQLASSRRSRTHAQLKPEDFAKPKVRKAFPDTIHWVANLRTDASGQATAKVTYPDALTTWRATARGITRDTKAGEAKQYTVSRKDLILTLAVPRFFTEGDEVTVSAIVRNYLDHEKQVRVSLEAKGIEITDGATVDLTIPSRGEAKADYRVRVLPGSEAVLLGQALSTEESDALELRLPIIPYGLKLTRSGGGVLTEASATGEFAAEFTAGAVAHTREIEISLAPTLTGALFDALGYLVNYPYGCTEQTTSALLGNVAVTEAVKELNLTTDLDLADVARKARAGIERLKESQNPDGGWGWWRTGDSEPFMTAYALLGLQRAAAAGYDVDYYLTNRAAQWLRQELPRIDEEFADLRAFVVHAMVRGGRSGNYQELADPLWTQRDKLSAYGLALLGLAFQQVEDTRAAEVATMLEASVKRRGTGAYWEVERDYFLGLYTSASPEATAHAVKLLARVRPESPLLGPAAAWLIESRDRGYYWGSTKQTSLVIFGLLDYLKAGGELAPDFTAAVEVNGQEVLKRRFTKDDVRRAEPVTLRLPADQLPAGPASVRIAKDGAGRLYWSARAVHYTSSGPPGPPGDRQLRAEREYFRLAPVERGQEIVYRLEPLRESPAPGDILAVRLTVRGDEFRYLLIEDPIPAGTELVPRDELYKLERPPEWWRSWASRRELRDDRAVYYRDQFSGREDVQYVHLLKVVNPGRFRVSPARVFPMYEPDYLAATDERTLEVR